MNRHDFAEDSTAPDWRGELTNCVLCPWPRKHLVHDVEDQADDTERIVGERVDVGSKD